MTKLLAAALLLLAAATTAAGAADRLPRSGSPVADLPQPAQDHSRPRAGGAAPDLPQQACAHRYCATPTLVAAIADPAA